MKRTSLVGGVRVLSNQLSSIVLIGDAIAAAPRSLALAVVEPRSLHIWQENVEDAIDGYRTFSQSIPVPAMDETTWQFNVTHESPTIQVGLVDVKALSVSAMLQIGSSKLVDTESRVKFVYRR